ncbi:Phosphoenolpyruvate-dihydroxyacetone phosphotransferase (EC, ADP-binding subunit DhaL [Olavius sp. associated proteobacterium Delta 1]|nr:Phosphoenolpyruvate-dihydroxyacetone phosphotransferase (EC, ADP-binding subunit DhaL [Olavius sp. associated proteobacterium Delta 1]
MTEARRIQIQALVPPTLNVIIAHAEELTRLDRAIGDGDHGINMKRGAEKILQELPAICDKPADEALKSMGMALVMSVGGASGPLFGSLLMGMGQSLGARAINKDILAECFSAGIEAVKKRGRSDVAQKTMLDVLVPALEVLKSNAAGSNLYAKLKETVAACETRTIGMKALKGRASYLGERSIGHMDPGARSCGLAIREICNVLEAAKNE